MQLISDAAVRGNSSPPNHLQAGRAPVIFDWRRKLKAH